MRIMDDVIGESLAAFDGDGDYLAYIEAFQSFLPSFEAILTAGKPADALALIEYALELIETNWETIGAIDVEMEFLVKDLQNLHLKACQDLKPDPKKLAKHLFEWAIRSRCGAFRNATHDYAAIYGQEGLQMVLDLANKGFNKSPTKQKALKGLSKRDSK
jgi:hypothetical protein